MRVVDPGGGAGDGGSGGGGGGGGGGSGGGWVRLQHVQSGECREWL